MFLTLSMFWCTLFPGPACSVFHYFQYRTASDGKLGGSGNGASSDKLDHVKTRISSIFSAFSKNETALYLSNRWGVKHLGLILAGTWGVLCQSLMASSINKEVVQQINNMVFFGWEHSVNYGGSRSTSDKHLKLSLYRSAEVFSQTVATTVMHTKIRGCSQTSLCHA